MTHGSLFSGIGGFDLAADWMGWKNLFHCEWNEFGQKVLNYYWPDAELFTDITKSDFTKYANRIDVLSGGFPCQPYSHAGKRLGKEDERHLWPEMLRAIREIQPTWVVGENVSGLISWNGGLVFHEVQTDLEAEGYEVWPVVLPACAVNAPHKRDRVYFIAYSGLQRQAERQQQPMGIEQLCEQQPTTNPKSEQSERMRPEQREFSEQEQRKFRGSGSGVGDRYATDPDSSRWGQIPMQSELWTGEPCQSPGNSRTANQTENGEGQEGEGRKQWRVPNWHNFPTQPPVCSRNDGVPTRLDGITFSKWRNESIKAYGNAVVPQVVYQIFKTIEAYEQTNQTTIPIHCCSGKTA